MMADGRAILEVGVLAAVLLLAAWAAFLCRPVDMRPDWPPSPASTSFVARRAMTTGAALLLLVAGVGLSLLVVVRLAS